MSTKLRISSRSKIEPFLAMDIFAKAHALIDQGHDVISMAVGQPGDKAPLGVREAAQSALQIDPIGYSNALGRDDLRAAIATHYGTHYGIDIDPARIAITTGSSAGFNLAFLSLFDVGDRIAISAPGYPAYRNIITALGLQVVEIETGAKGNIDAADIIAAHAQTPLNGVLFASPANPTGTVIDREELAKIIDVGKDFGITLISDEIYHRLAYEKDDVTALEFSNDVIVINSFSKYYCMTGWRIGWMVLPQNLVRTIECLAQSLYICAPQLSQVAAIQAFNSTTELEEIKGRYRQNRTHLMQALPQLGFEFAAPVDGAFYAYCDVSKFCDDSVEFADRMLNEALVAATPGRDFDPINGHKTMRFSYAGAPNKMIEATTRLQRWLSR